MQSLIQRFKPSYRVKKVEFNTKNSEFGKYKSFDKIILKFNRTGYLKSTRS